MPIEPNLLTLGALLLAIAIAASIGGLLGRLVRFSLDHRAARRRRSAASAPVRPPVPAVPSVQPAPAIPSVQPPVPQSSQPSREPQVALAAAPEPPTQVRPATVAGTAFTLEARPAARWQARPGLEGAGEEATPPGVLGFGVGTPRLAQRLGPAQSPVATRLPSPLSPALQARGEPPATPVPGVRRTHRRLAGVALSAVAAVAAIAVLVASGGPLSGPRGAVLRATGSPDAPASASVPGLAITSPGTPGGGGPGPTADPGSGGGTPAAGEAATGGAGGRTAAASPAPGSTPAPGTTSSPGATETPPAITPAPPDPTAEPTPPPTAAPKAPSVAFNVAVEGLTATFTNRTRGADTWTWTFGDGTTSTERNPVHAYAEAGTYTVTLAARSTTGATASLSKQVTVVP